MRLHTERGLSYRKIGVALGISGPTAYALVQRGQARLAKHCADRGIEDVTATLRAQFGEPDNAAEELRQDKAADAVEARMIARLAELSMIETCMRGDVQQTTWHRELNTWDRWELAELNRRGVASLSSDMYEARRLARYANGAGGVGG